MVNHLRIALLMACSFVMARPRLDQIKFSLGYNFSYLDEYHNTGILEEHQFQTPYISIEGLKSFRPRMEMFFGLEYDFSRFCHGTAWLNNHTNKTNSKYIFISPYAGLRFKFSDQLGLFYGIGSRLNFYRVKFDYDDPYSDYANNSNLSIFLQFMHRGQIRNLDTELSFEFGPRDYYLTDGMGFRFELALSKPIKIDLHHGIRLSYSRWNFQKEKILPIDGWKAHTQHWRCGYEILWK